MRRPRWFVDGNRLFKVKEVKETKKTFILSMEGLKGIKQLKKNDKRFRYGRRKPKF